MNYAIVAAVLAAILLLVQRMISSAKADHVINELRPEEARKQAEAYAKEAARLEQEIKNADLRYSKAKRDLESSARNPDGTPYLGTSDGKSVTLPRDN
jgi:hypothetical protein